MLLKLYKSPAEPVPSALMWQGGHTPAGDSGSISGALAAALSVVSTALPQCNTLYRHVLQSIWRFRLIALPFSDDFAPAF